MSVTPDRKLKMVHATRLSQYPFLWKFTFKNGMTKVIGSEMDRPPYNIATREGNRNDWGSVVTHHKLPKEAAQKYIRELLESASEVKDPEKYQDINTPEDIAPSNGHLFEKDIPVQVLEELSTPEIVESVILYDKLKNSVNEEDEILLDLIIKGQGVSKKTMERFERFFSMFSNADQTDEDEIDLLLYYVNLIQKGVSSLDDVIESIKKNLEGSDGKE